MILQRWRRSAEKPRVVGPPGYRAYAVGDVHGRLDLLNGLLRQIEADNEARGGDAKPLLIFLGDLIDRGPDSAGVVERVKSEPLPGFRTVVLGGNHEEVLLHVLEGDAGVLTQWLQFGGREALASYGVDAASLDNLEDGEKIRRIRAAIPAEHQRFLAGLGDTFRFGDYLFVHAGLRPGLPLDQQSATDLRWIRHPFLSDRRDHGAVVVHGHTISRDIDEQPNRIGIDTGAHHFGVLTALCIEGEQRWYLQESDALPRKRQR